MAEATAEQIQRFANERVRVRAEQIRALLLAMKDDRAAIDDVYAALNVGGSQVGWVDNRTDGPPTLLTKDEVLSYNTLAADTITFLEEHTQLAPVMSACVRPVNG